MGCGVETADSPVLWLCVAGVVGFNDKLLSAFLNISYPYGASKLHLEFDTLNFVNTEGCP
jgi:hypothetical protein